MLHKHTTRFESGFRGLWIKAIIKIESLASVCSNFNRLNDRIDVIEIVIFSLAVPRRLLCFGSLVVLGALYAYYVKIGNR